MNKQQKQLLELYYIQLCLRLFAKFRNPADVFSFLKACCIMFQLDRDMVQQVTLKVMRQQYNVDVIIAEICYLAHCAGADVSELVRFSGRPKSTVYRKLRQLGKDYHATCLIMTEKELVVVKDFLYNYKYLGGLII